MWSTSRTTLAVSIALLALNVLASCSKREQSDAEVGTGSKVVVSSTPPFQTKEPDTYQAIRSISFTPASGGQSIVVTHTIAKDGAARREEDTAAANRRVVYLDIPTGRFVLLPDEKVYAELNGNASIDSTEPPVDNPTDLYAHTGPIQTSYESIGTEEINGRMTKKYRIVVNGSGGGSVSNNETLVWVDEALQMPVKSSIRSAGGIRVMEMSAVKLDVDRQLFKIPEGYQKIEIAALRAKLR